MSGEAAGCPDCMAHLRGDEDHRWDTLGDFAGGFFEEFVGEGLAGFGLLGGDLAEQRHVSYLRRLEI
jgi:hypothetical protein